jgi:peptidoglycan/LPS O-acetylase OafA/YrhL
MQYVSSLDGTRGIAVLLVMLFHFGYFPAGWIGVQIFFVLSGYLITSILTEDKNKSLPAFIGRFYWRRLLRIFPLYYGFLVVAALAYTLYRVPVSFSSDWPWLFTYTANFARMRDSDVGAPFVHLWSLAVEEQFYLVWPFLVYFLRPATFRKVIVGILLLSPVIRLALFQGALSLGSDEEYAGKAAYVLPFTQFDAFAAGAAISLWNLREMRNASYRFLGALLLAAAAGLAVLVAGHFWGRGASIASLGYSPYLISGHGYVWGYSLINLLSALGIICALQGAGVARCLNVKPLVWVGKISYGIYVYHLPLLLIGIALLSHLQIVPDGGGRLVFFIVWVAVVLLVSAASFYWFEVLFLRLKDRVRERAGSRPALREQQKNPERVAGS